MPQCINRGNGYVINDHLQAKKTGAGCAPRYVITTTGAEIKIRYTFFFLILWLFDFSVSLLVLVLQAAVIGFTNLYQSIRETMHVVMNRCVKCYTLLSFISLLHCLHPHITKCWHGPPLVYIS